MQTAHFVMVVRIHLVAFSVMICLVMNCVGTSLSFPWKQTEDQVTPVNGKSELCVTSLVTSLSTHVPLSPSSPLKPLPIPLSTPHLSLFTPQPLSPSLSPPPPFSTPTLLHSPPFSTLHPSPLLTLLHSSPFSLPPMQ